MKNLRPLFVAHSIENIITENINCDIKINSVFNNCINLELGERIISIFGNEKNKIPFGINLNDEDFNLLKGLIYCDMKIRADNQGVYFDEILIIEFKSSIDIIEDKVNGKVEIYSLEKNIKFLSEFVLEEQWSCGFNYELKSIIRYLLYNEGNNEILEFINNVDFINCIEEISDDRCYNFINFFVGRGKGLTPSGDDMIIGMMAMLNSSGIKIDALSRCFDIYLNSLGEVRTTRISFEYLFYANNKLFVSALRRLCCSILYLGEEAIVQAAIELKEYGSTSPIDSIIGILLASKILIKNCNLII